MGNFLSLIGSLVSSNSSPLKHPGDKLTAEVTKSGRQVVKLYTSEQGKVSATRYNNGTMVFTRSTKPKR